MWKIYKFDNDIPIYKQIVREIGIKIITNQYEINQKLPSVREFAIEYKVNPNTVQRALLELENNNLIYTERTNGKYVTNDKHIINKFKEQIASEKVIQFIEEMKKLGYTKTEINKIIGGK